MKRLGSSIARSTVRARRFPSAISWSIRVGRTLTSANSAATKKPLMKTRSRTAPILRRFAVSSLSIAFSTDQWSLDSSRPHGPGPYPPKRVAGRKSQVAGRRLQLWGGGCQAADLRPGIFNLQPSTRFDVVDGQRHLEDPHARLDAVALAHAGPPAVGLLDRGHLLAGLPDV